MQIAGFTLPELNFVQIVTLLVTLYFLRKVFRRAVEFVKQLRAFNEYQRFRKNQESQYYAHFSGGGATDKNNVPNPFRNTDANNPVRQEHFKHPLYKNKDEQIVGMSKPKGFWSNIIMSERMTLIREMIRISTSAESRGYWQDFMQAQKGAERTRDDQPQR